MHFRTMTMILLIFIHFFYAIKNYHDLLDEKYLVIDCRFASQAAITHLVPLGNVQAYTMYYNSALHFVSMIVGGWFAKQDIDGSEMRIKMCWPLLAHHQGVPKSDAVLDSILPNMFIPMSFSVGSEAMWSSNEKYRLFVVPLSTVYRISAKAHEKWSQYFYIYSQ